MAGSKTADDGESGTCGLTRRRLLQGAGGTLVAVAGAGLLAPLGAARPEEEIFRRHAGEIRLFVGTRLPPGWLPCDGRQFTRSEYPQLAEALSYRYSPSGQIPRFRLPDLRGRTAIGHGEGPGQPARYLGHRGDALAEGGDGPGGLGLTYIIATHDGDGRSIVGEVRPFAFHRLPTDGVIDGYPRVGALSRAGAESGTSREPGARLTDPQDARTGWETLRPRPARPDSSRSRRRSPRTAQAGLSRGTGR